MALTLVILNDAPYGSERSYNALRLATSLARREGERVRVFLMGDAASCAKAGQRLPSGYYCVEAMLRVLHGLHVMIGVCGTCMDARGLKDAELAQGAHRSTLDELTSWTIEADKLIAF